MMTSNLRCRNEASQWKYDSNRQRRIPILLSVLAICVTVIVTAIIDAFK